MLGVLVGGTRRGADEATLVDGMCVAMAHDR